MKRLVLLALALAACGDDGKAAGPVDARPDSRPGEDSAIDAPDIDAPDIDAAPDAMLSPAESIGSVRAATDGAVTLKVVGATVTYIKAALGSATNDPAGFTVQATQAGPALFVSVDPATLTALTPALAVGDTLSFTVTMKSTVGGQPRAAAISDVMRTATAVDVTTLGKDVSAATDLVTAIDDYDSELVTLTGTVNTAFASSGSMWVAAQITTAGITTAAPTFLLRLPATLVTSTKIANGCTFTVTDTPVNRFKPATGDSETEISAQYAADISVTACPAPTVAMTTDVDAMTVKLVFSNALDPATVDMSKFTIADATLAPLAVTAASLSVDGFTVTLTTAAQTPAAVYTVTVDPTVKDLFGTVIGTPNTGMFTGYSPPPVANHVVINEVDYDTAGGDDVSEFLELYNPTNAAIDVSNMQIVLVNGNTTATPALYSTHATYDLSTVGTLEAHQYLVIGTATLIAGLDTTTPDPDIKTLAFALVKDNLQQGPRDAVFLINKGDMAMSVAPSIIDSITYGGNTTGNLTYTVGGQMITFAPEGTSSTAVDDNANMTSLCRVPDGADTDNNHDDIKACTQNTPGAANTL